MTINELAGLNSDFLVYDFKTMTYLGANAKGTGYNGESEVKRLAVQRIGWGAKIVALVDRQEKEKKK